MKPTSLKRREGVLSRSRLVFTLKRLKRQGKRIAFTNGCFDLLHLGHLSYLKAVKRHADILVVGVNSDRSVRRLKGPGRPLIPDTQRAQLVAALKPVDLVTLFSESTPLILIQAVRPDLLAKGGDWKPDQIVGATFVRSYGGRVLSIPLLKGHSTTTILQKARKTRLQVAHR